MFLPFWTELASEGRSEYLTRWPPPDEDWAENLAQNAAAGPRVLDFESLPPPPWERYRTRGPNWIGWHFGGPRHWLREEFMPFWLMLRSEDQAAYMLHWPPPTEAWRRRLEALELNAR